jgi:ADP-ribose pyrophosphatase YjhB (NUDIX family)
LSAEEEFTSRLRRLQALARTGLHYCATEYDRDRYEEIERLAAALLADGRPEGIAALAEAWSGERGYVTPKIEVRGAHFTDDRVLLVLERADGLWTLPGGWADVGESPSRAVEKEFEQEAGLRVRAFKLAGLLDPKRDDGRPVLFHAWKALFLCEVLGGEVRGSYETAAVEYFPIEALPPLSLGRSTPAQIRRLHQHWRHRDLGTDFD